MSTINVNMLIILKLESMRESCLANWLIVSLLLIKVTGICGDVVLKKINIDQFVTIFVKWQICTTAQIVCLENIRLSKVELFFQRLFLGLLTIFSCEILPPK